jgi:hypothetical protein
MVSKVVIEFTEGNNTHLFREFRPIRIRQNIILKSQKNRKHALSKEQNT